MTARDVTNSMVVNLAGSSQVAPTFWLNPQNGVSYPIVMQTPQYRLDSLSALANMPINGSTGAASQQVLGGIANFTRAAGNALFSQYDIQPMVQIYATTQDRDLGAVAADIRKVHRANRESGAEGHLGRAARPGAHDGERVLGPAVRPARRDRADLSADRRQLPVVERIRS